MTSRGVDALIERLHRDNEWLARHDIELSQITPDQESGKVTVYLTRYRDEAKQMLVERYGPDLLVSTESRIWSSWTGRRQP